MAKKPVYKLKPNGKKATGAPTKLKSIFIKAAQKVLDNDIKTIILTDEELVDEINDTLKNKNDRISYQTLTNWKRTAKECGIENLGDIAKQFFMLYKKALRRIKQNLIEKQLNEDKSWQRFSWILERKFDEWNIRQIQEVSIDDATTDPAVLQDKMAKLMSKSKLHVVKDKSA